MITVTVPLNVDGQAAQFGYDDPVEPPEDEAPEYQPRVSGVDLGLMAQLDKLKQLKARHKRLTEDTAAQIAAIEERVIEQMFEAGQDRGLPYSPTRKGTVRVDTWPKWETDDVEARIAAFEAAGPEWAALVKRTINSQTLQGFLNALEEMDLDEGGPGLPECLPDPIKAVMTTTDKFSVTFSAVEQARQSRRKRPPRTGASRADAVPDRA